MADWLQVENWRMRKDVERIAELERETASLKSALTDFEKRCAEHEQFRVQHKDCDAMGVENQSLRRALKDCEAKCAQHAAAIEVWQREAQSAQAEVEMLRHEHQRTQSDLEVLATVVRTGFHPPQSKTWTDDIYFKTALRAVDMHTALDESVKLQSHYAELLNMYDGGKRIILKDADDWIRRMHVVRAERNLYEALGPAVGFMEPPK